MSEANAENWHDLLAAATKRAENAEAEMRELQAYISALQARCAELDGGLRLCIGQMLIIPYPKVSDEAVESYCKEFMRLGAAMRELDDILNDIPRSEGE